MAYPQNHPADSRAEAVVVAGAAALATKSTGFSFDT
jgi:hypothetical protein